MPEYRTTDAVELTGTTAKCIVPAPPDGILEIAQGGLVFQNRDATDHTLTIEVRKSTTTVNLFDNTLEAGQTLIWDHIVRIPQDFTGIFAYTATTAATLPTAYYTGTL